jgi:imidazoleglycerol-phosphate dehydratase
MNIRNAEISRNTKETQITASLTIDGSGSSNINTGIPFLDHMLELFAKHGFFDLNIDATGDLEIDCHHTVEDIALVLGSAFDQALGERIGIKRYGWCMLPMDETLVAVALDLSRRPFLVYDLNPPVPYIKDLDTKLFHEFFQAFSVKAGMNLHIKLMEGKEVHHIFEAVFKALAKALDQAVSIDKRINGVLSTKGSL